MEEHYRSEEVDRSDHPLFDLDLLMFNRPFAPRAPSDRHRSINVSWALVLLVCMVLSLSHSSLAGDKPNIVLMLVDDMGIMDSSLPFLTDEKGQAKRYPLNDFYRTPNMERLASSGIRFNNFYAMSVCSPTRISIMTGQNAARHRTTNWINPDQDNAGPSGPSDWNWKGFINETSRSRDCSKKPVTRRFMWVKGTLVHVAAREAIRSTSASM